MKACPECGSANLRHYNYVEGDILHQLVCLDCGKTADCATDKQFDDLWHVELNESDQIDFKICRHMGCEHLIIGGLDLNKANSSYSKPLEIFECRMAFSALVDFGGDMKLPERCKYLLEQIAVRYNKEHSNA